MSKIYIEKLENIEDSFIKCLNRIKSWKSNTPINSVLIKPNFVNDMPSEKGVTTSLLLIDRIIEFLHNCNINTIAIAESSILDTETVFSNLNLGTYEKEGIKVINLEKYDLKTVSSPLGLSITNFAFPTIIHNYDLIINIPKMKTHILTGVTLGMKNLFAFFSRAGRKYAHVTDIDLAIVDMYAYISSIKPIITIIDATIAMSGNRGPIHGNPVNLGIVLMGCDTVAVDAGAVEIMGSNYNSIRHIALGIQHKLGNTANIINNSGIEIRAIQKQFNVPVPSLPLKDTLVKLKNVIFRKRPFLESPGNCTQCRSCIQICPKHCINLENNEIVINYTNCVSCLCCCEACKYKAMGHKVRFGAMYNCLLFVKHISIQFKRCTYLKSRFNAFIS